LTAIFVATPGQDNRVLAVEIGVVGLAVAVGALVSGLYQREERTRAPTMYVTLVPRVSALRLFVCAAWLWRQRGGGLFGLPAAVQRVLAPARPNAWVLLVEIKR
jgi:hypothetical protein